MYEKNLISSNELKCSFINYVMNMQSVFKTVSVFKTAMIDVI